MSFTEKSDKTLTSLSRKVLACFSLEWLAILPDLYRLIRQWITGRQHEGMYEILDYDTTLELLDPKGKKAIFQKRQQVRFLQDHIIAFQDYA